MNKRHGIIAVALVALLLATSCSTFFTGGVSGKVKCNGDPVVGATVALYFDESQRNADLQAENKVFHTDFKTETTEGGRFSITNIPWDDAFPEYGKDADSKTAYALVYHKDYGYLPVDGITVISGRPNEFFPEYSQNLTKTESVHVKFMNPETNILEPGISSVKITYDGRPGYTKEHPYEETVSVTGGVANFNVVYQGDAIPVFDITEIKYATYDGNKPYATIVDKTPVGKADSSSGQNLYKVDSTGKVLENKVDSNNTVIIYAIPYAYEFRGFNGSVKNDLDRPTAISIYKENAINNENLKDTVITKKSGERDMHFNIFEGLGSNITLVNEEKADYQNPEIKGYPAVIEEKFSIFNDDASNVFTASSNPKAVTTVTVKNV